MEELIEQFKKLPDWVNYPLPEVLYKKYGLPVPKPSDDLMAAINRQLTPPTSEWLPPETRGPVPGGVREVILPEIDLGCHVETIEESADSTTTIETKIPELEAPTVPNPPSNDVSVNKEPSEPHHDAE